MLMLFGESDQEQYSSDSSSCRCSSAFSYDEDECMSNDKDSDLSSSSYETLSVIGEEKEEANEVEEEEVDKMDSRNHHQQQQREHHHDQQWQKTVTNGASVVDGKESVTTTKRKRADQVQSLFAFSDMLSTVECWGFSNDDPYSVFGFRQKDMWTFQNKDSPDHVVVAVEATAICSRDDCAPFGDQTLPFGIGSNFVGIVHDCNHIAGLKPGMRVASILKMGANSKFITAPAANLHTINNKLDASDVVSLISSYLPAFQALYHGIPRPFRYNKYGLKGKRVLVIGGALLEAQAVLRLARWSGASELYITAPRNHFPLLKRITAVTVLGDDPKEWLRICKNRMDIVVDYRFPNNLSSVQESLARKGRLVCIAPRKNGNKNSTISDVVRFIQQSQLSLIKRASMFDFAENFHMYPAELRDDVEFLLKLLSTRQVRPQVDRVIKLRDAPKAHKDIQSLPLAGSIICEPWKK